MFCTQKSSLLSTYSQRQRPADIGQKDGKQTAPEDNHGNGDRLSLRGDGILVPIANRSARNDGKPNAIPPRVEIRGVPFFEKILQVPEQQNDRQHDGYDFWENDEVSDGILDAPDNFDNNVNGHHPRSKELYFYPSISSWVDKFALPTRIIPVNESRGNTRMVQPVVFDINI